MRARNVRNAERLTEHTVRLQPLKIGERVFIQNQTGNHPLRQDRTGLVIKVKQLDQYAVKVDGSGSYSLELEISTEIRQDRCGPHTRYYPHHPTFENSLQRRESVSGESTNQPKTVTRST